MHINKLFSLEGKTAVVIGGAGKIGFPMVEALAEAGALVYIASSREDGYEEAVQKLLGAVLTVDSGWTTT